MADFCKRSRAENPAAQEDRREAELRAREKFRIETLGDEAELIDERAFSNMHARLVMPAGSAG